MKVEWNQDACCHSGNCVRTLPAVFAVENGSFVIRPDKGTEAEINTVIEACPARALSWGEDSTA